MVVTDVWYAVDNLFAIELQNDTESPVRRRVVRTEVEEHEVLVFGAALHPPLCPDLRVLSGVDGLPPLPDTEYLLCYDPSSNNELAQVIYQAMESYHNPWQYSPMSAPEGDDSLLIERDIE